MITNCQQLWALAISGKTNSLVINKAVRRDAIPLYGDGLNVRDWLYVEDHVDALLLAACRGESGRSYCIGGHGEKTNKEVVETICHYLDGLQPENGPHTDLITRVTDRPGHDRRYAIDSSRIWKNWAGSHAQSGKRPDTTIDWYLNHQKWCFNEQPSALRRRTIGPGLNSNNQLFTHSTVTLLAKLRG